MHKVCPRPPGAWGGAMTAMPIRIIALFGSRAFFGQERANMHALATLQSEGCQVLCAIRHEEWPELLDLRQRLSIHGLRYAPVQYMDFPRRGWLIRALLRNPVAFAVGNVELARLIGDFRPTHIHAFNQWYLWNFAPAMRRRPLPVIFRAGEMPSLHNAFWRHLWRYVK